MEKRSLKSAKQQKQDGDNMMINETKAIINHQNDSVLDEKRKSFQNKLNRSMDFFTGKKSTIPSSSSMEAMNKNPSNSLINYSTSGVSSNNNLPTTATNKNINTAFSATSNNSNNTNSNTNITKTNSSDKWLLANHDLDARIFTFSSGITTADLYHDGDYRLLIGDIGLNNVPKLRVYHGMLLQSENLLVDIPCGVVVVDSDKADSTSVIVASGSYLYVYRNLKPFYKFSLPPLEINQIELDAWQRFKDQKINHQTLEEILNNVRLEIGRRLLTSRTQMFLAMAAENKQPFANHYKHQPLKKMNVITCLAVLKKTIAETMAPSCLVLGTENQDVYILEIEAFTILTSATLPSVPVFIEASGLFDVDYRILFSCRDAHIYLLKHGYQSGRLCIQLNAQPVGLVRIGGTNNTIYVATMDQTLNIYTNKGQRIWNMRMPAIITTMEAIFLERQGLHLVAVALTNNTVMFYHDRKCVDVFQMNDIVVAMKYGRFGREDNTLIMITKNGSLMVKILKRTAKFYELETKKSINIAKLIVPKKTKLFVDQTMREREQYLGIHKTFEHELLRLKLDTYKTYVKAFQSNINPIAMNQTKSIKLSAKVIGLGPVFQIQFELQQCNNQEDFLTSLKVLFDFDANIYRIQSKMFHLSCLTSQTTYKYNNRIECINEMNLADIIKIYVLNENDEIPMLTVIINMPTSEIINQDDRPTPSINNNFQTTDL